MPHTCRSQTAQLGGELNLRRKNASGDFHRRENPARSRRNPESGLDPQSSGVMRVLAARSPRGSGHTTCILPSWSCDERCRNADHAPQHKHPRLLTNCPLCRDSLPAPARRGGSTTVHSRSRGRSMLPHRQSVQIPLCACVVSIYPRHHTRQAAPQLGSRSRTSLSGRRPRYWRIRSQQ